MCSIVAQFCKQCGAWKLAKDSTQYAHRALQLLLVPSVHLHLYTFDFVTYLPPEQGFNCILTVIDHLTKLTFFIPCTIGEDKLLAAQVTKLLFENIARFFWVPKKLIHDCNPRFTAQL